MATQLTELLRALASLREQERVARPKREKTLEARGEWSTPVLGADGVALQGNIATGTTVSPTGVFQFDTQGRLASSPASTLTVGARTISIDAGSGYVQVQ